MPYKIVSIKNKKQKTKNYDFEEKYALSIQRALLRQNSYA